MKNHGNAERLSGMVGHARERLERSRMVKLDRDNDRLRTEVGLLRDDLDAERSSLKDALKGLEAHTVTVREGRRHHLIRDLVIAAGAYVLGTRDGHERYEQIVQKAKSLSERATLRAKMRDRTDWDSSRTDGEAITPRTPSSS